MTTFLTYSEINEMSVRKINAYFRKNDESKKWPVCGQFNATERAIRRVKRMMLNCSGLEYYLTLENEICEIVNACC